MLSTEWANRMASNLESYDFVGKTFSVLGDSISTGGLTVLTQFENIQMTYVPTNDIYRTDIFTFNSNIFAEDTTFYFNSYEHPLSILEIEDSDFMCLSYNGQYIITDQGPNQWLPEDINEPFYNILYYFDEETSSLIMLIQSSENLSNMNITIYQRTFPLAWSEDAMDYYSGVNYVAEDCWWYYLIKKLGMELLSNNSWGGRRVTNTADIASHAPGGFHQTEINLLQMNNQQPDIIIIKLGINDFQNEVELGDYDGSTTLSEEVEKYPNANVAYANFSVAYATLLDRVTTTYPNAKIYCCTLAPIDANGDTPASRGTEIIFPELNNNGIALTTYNKRIRELAQAFGVTVIECESCGINYLNIWETVVYGTRVILVHPNRKGLELIGNTVVNAILYK